MSDKIISERGLSTFTRPDPVVFEFDAQTRKIELVQYFSYCQRNNLLSTEKEQARTSLIRKAFEFLGGTGSDWRSVMVSWLQDVTGFSSTDLYALWEEYFTIHATTPDTEGVTYENLSVEAGYRKFLYQFIGSENVYYDQLRLQDFTRWRLRKALTDGVGISDSLSTAAKYYRTYTDGVGAHDQTTTKLNKGLTDGAGVSDTVRGTLKKTLVDTVHLADVIGVEGGDTLVGASGNEYDQLFIRDLVRFSISKALADGAETSDSVKHKLIKSLSNGAQLSDSLSFYMQYGREEFDFIVIADDPQLKTTKALSNGIQMSDSLSGVIVGTSTVADPIEDLAALAGLSQVQLSWTAPDNGGGTITDYTIEYKASSSSTWLTFSDGTSTATTATVTGLTNDISYDFRVFVQNVNGASDSSNVATATPSVLTLSPVIWLDASDAASITKNVDDLVEQWADKSGNGNHALQTADLQKPKYVASVFGSLAALKGYHDLANASNLSILDNATLNYSRYTSFLVFKRVTDMGALEQMAGKYSGTSTQREHRFYISSTDVLTMSQSTDGSNATTTARNISTSIALNAAHLITSWYDGTNQKGSMDGGSIVSQAVGNPWNDISPYRYFSRNGNADPFGGYLAEHLFFNRELTSGEITAVNNYLKSKWGI